MKNSLYSKSSTNFDNNLMMKSSLVEWILVSRSSSSWSFCSKELYSGTYSSNIRLYRSGLSCLKNGWFGASTNTITDNKASGCKEQHSARLLHHVNQEEYH